MTLKEIGKALPFAAILLSLVVIEACSGYGKRVAPVILPGATNNATDVAGAKVSATPYEAANAAKAAFGFDIRGAGVLPVRFVIDNQSKQSVHVIPDQTFLVDAQGRAWPLLTADQTYQRIRAHVEMAETMKGASKPALLLGAAGAVAGLAVGVVTGGNVGDTAAKGAVIGGAAGAIGGGAAENQSLESKIRNDLEQESLRNRDIGRGELAYGYLFFPGMNEASSVKALRLALNVDGQQKIVTIAF